ncbi:molybdopterin molybdenumtransferase MoeA [Oerskovia turbata]|uniref:Molybdopterin molybdenumtransferase n=1 Tax=Oerskovia turbata TaxID=1713 RepID=A0A4Q1L1G2_9CELL|nr:molybdopterin molybdenumtransferase MoeA [Oerskovia turbata]RXR36055.1 molybdopterin molybdenumtransferase MoeA [Oerskovia turbata]
MSVEQHRREVEALLRPALADRHVERVVLADALDRVLAADLFAPVDLPAFRSSQMDGYAVRSADVAGASVGAPVVLPVVAEIPAGPGTPVVLAPGTAARIMTGAVVPEGSDAVVPVEDTDAVRFGVHATGAPRGSAGTDVGVLAPRGAGELVRDVGSDVRGGELVLAAGTRLGPQHLAAAASCGVPVLEVRARVRVAVVSTGTEVVEPGEAAATGQVYDANLPGLAAAARRAGADVVLTGRTGDDPRELAALLARAAEVADLVLTSGGVSQGAYEVVKDTLGDGVTFRSVAMQPGGPQGFGTHNGTPVLTFPGNPVSAQVSFAVFARPVLEHAAGLPAREDETRTVTAAIDSPPAKRQMLRGRLGADGTVEVVGGAGSHLVATMAAADVLIEVPEGVDRVEAGEIVRVVRL